MTLEDEVRDPYLLEFLNLKDEHSENEVNLIDHLGRRGYIDFGELLDTNGMSG